MFDKNAKLDIPCENCGHETKFSIKELEKNPSYVCSECGTKNNIDASEFKKGLKEAEQMIKDVFKDF